MVEGFGLIGKVKKEIAILTTVELNNTTSLMFVKFIFIEPLTFQKRLNFSKYIEIKS